jgi:hypothetical protein
MMPTKTDIVPTPPATELNQDQSAQLMTDPTFRGRVKVCCLKYADSVLISTTPVAQQTASVKWAFRCFQMPDTTAQDVQPSAVMDPKVQTAGSAVSDSDLQSAVEASVAKIIA